MTQQETNRAGRPAVELSEEVIAKIRELRIAGLSKRVIATEVHTAVRKVESVLQRAGLSESVRAIPKWEGERAARFTEMWNAGVPRQDLMTTFEVSKNSIDHAVKLLRLPSRKGMPRPLSKANPKPRLRVVPQVESLVLPSGLHVTIMELEADMCRWPIGDPRDSDFHFCGHPSANGRSYCEHHLSRSLEKPREDSSHVRKTIPTVWLRGIAA